MDNKGKVLAVKITTVGPRGEYIKYLAACEEWRKECLAALHAPCASSCSSFIPPPVKPIQTFIVRKRDVDRFIKQRQEQIFQYSQSDPKYVDPENVYDKIDRPENTGHVYAVVSRDDDSIWDIAIARDGVWSEFPPHFHNTDPKFVVIYQCLGTLEDGFPPETNIYMQDEFGAWDDPAFAPKPEPEPDYDEYDDFWDY